MFANYSIVQRGGNKTYCRGWLSPLPHDPHGSEAAGSSEWIHTAGLKSHQRVRNSSIAAARFLFFFLFLFSAACYGARGGYRGGVCPLTLCVFSPSVPPRARADRDGGFAVWFSSRGSIDSFKVESTCHCFNHPWPQLHVGRPQRGTGSAALYVCVFVCEELREREKDEGETDI